MPLFAHGRSIPHAAGGHIVALITRRRGRRVDGTAWQVTCSPTQINESTRPWTWRRSGPKCGYWAWRLRSLFNY